ncbi:probable NOT transcription complex subunit VIP2 [Olea europaea var. sylvestris]|uniref:probable NOT transcription complex subunit VIP2 n=1 Tax=Olea europaea var. sylvestris TaxID=158386 RepID=UPI000C1D388C|nr:probable NOT transcription complex subunit VIP2 [Olea europaea var. sylvestris]
MSGVLGSALNGSNSNLSDTMGRPFATSFSAQTASSGAVLNQSGGTIQGPHYIHGNFNISNMSGSFASRNSTNIGGLPNSIQQAAGNVSNGRYAMNSIPTALSQLSLGSSNGHGGVNNIGGPGVLQNMGNNGRITNSVGSLNGGGNTTRGLSSAGLANIPGLASRLNLSGNIISRYGFHIGRLELLAACLTVVPVMNYNYRLNGTGNAEFPVNARQKEQLHASTEFPVNARQKEQLHDSMASLMQPQQLTMGRSSGFNFSGTYSSHHPQQQHHASSINGSGASLLTAGNQDFHFHGPEQYQQFQQSQSRFISPFRDKDLKSMQALQSVPDRFGMLGLLSVIKMTNPGLSSLALGIDLTSLGLNLNSSETIHKKFASPWSDEPARGEPEYSVPECYYAKPPPPVNQSYFARFSQETLFYIFYSMPKDRAQLFAANELYTRGWFYHKDLRLWFTRVKDMEPLVETNTYERGCYYFFDPNTWQMTRKDNFVLIYEMVEKRPTLPQ